MLYDLGEVLANDAIIMLPEWETSTGAKAERFVAEMCGKRVILAFFRNGVWCFKDDPVQKRLTTAVLEPVA